MPIHLKILCVDEAQTKGKNVVIVADRTRELQSAWSYLAAVLKIGRMYTLKIQNDYIQ